MKTQKIAAGQFKAKCLRLLDEVGDRHFRLLITKHGKALAMLVPVEQETSSLFGCMKDMMLIKGDIVASTDEKWEADEN